MGLASNLDTRQSLVNDIHDFDDEGFYWLILSRQQSLASNGSRCAVNGTCGTCVCGHKSEQDMEGSTDDRQPPEKVIQEFWHQQHIGEAPDFVIELEKNNIPCHKSILRKASSYFEALFSSQMKECENNRVKLIDTHVHDFMSLVKFAYTGQLDISKETVFSVTALANMYQFNSALKFAQKFLVSQVASETWREILQFSELHDLKDVHYVAFRYVLWNFSKEVKSEIENFQVLSKTSLEKLLGHPLLNCTSESEVVQVLSAWCGYDEKRTQEVFTDVFFSTVYLNELTAEELDAILNLECVQNNSAVKKFVEETAVNEISANASSQSKPVCKKTRAGPLVLLCVGGDLNLGETTVPSKCIYKIDMTSGEATEHADLHQVFPTQRTNMGYRAVCVDTDLYVIGGETVLGRNTWQTDIWKYSSFSSTWSLATQLQQPRRHHGICTLGGEIYLIGGIGRFRQVLNSVEKYNPQTDEWNSLSPLLKPEFWPAVTVCQGDLYVIKNSLQKYSPSRDQWTLVTGDLPFNLGYHSAVSLGSTVFMKCQYDGRLVRLETDSNPLSAETVAEFLGTPNGQLVLHRGRLYCVGGTDCTAFQYYDVKKQKIETVGKLNLPLCGFSTVLQPFYPFPL